MANTVVVQRPDAPPSPLSPELTGWSSDLLECCDDMNMCCYAFWCCPCFACSTAKRFGERRCFPLLDILTPALMTAAGIPLCVPPAGLALRVAIRHTYGIKGTLCKDVMAVCFCGCCSWCQIAREIKIRNGAVCVSHGPSQGGVVTMQPPPTTTTLTSPQVQLVHHPSFIAPSNGYGPLAPAPPGPVAPVYFTAWTAETRPPSALGGGAYALPGYPFQSDFL